MLFDGTGLVLGLYFLLPSCLAASNSSSRLSTSGSSSQSSRSFKTTRSLSSSASPTQPSPPINVQLTLDHGTERDLDTLATRRRGIIEDSIIDANFTSTWCGASFHPIVKHMSLFIFFRISTLGRDGKWPDIDYTAGCKAQPASWPAYFHWKRLG